MVEHVDDTELNQAIESGRGGPRSPTRFTQFFFFPLFVAAGCFAIMGLFSWMGQDARTPEELLAVVRNVPGRQRWQAAQEFSQRVTADGGLRSDPVIARQALSLFVLAREGDPEIARFLAHVVGLMAYEGAGEELVEALGSEDVSLRIQVALALVQLGEKEWVSRLEPLLADEDPGVRKVTTYALGKLGGTDEVRMVAPLLSDHEVDVRWNAALALATLGSDEGNDMLREMLDREYLGKVSNNVRAREGRGMRDSEVTDVMVNAIRAVAKTESHAFMGILERLREEDESPRVQEAARLALVRMEER